MEHYDTWHSQKPFSVASCPLQFSGMRKPPGSRVKSKPYIPYWEKALMEADYSKETGSPGLVILRLVRKLITNKVVIKFCRSDPNSFGGACTHISLVLISAYKFVIYYDGNYNMRDRWCCRQHPCSLHQGLDLIFVDSSLKSLLSLIYRRKIRIIS